MQRGTRFGLLIALAVLAVPLAAQGSSVAPTTMPDNPGCADLNPSWSELKIDQLPHNRTYGNSDLSVTISNVTGGETFDWSATHSVDAVLVKSATVTNIYTYDPEALSDTHVSGPAGHEISHVSFCYDAGDSTVPTPPAGTGNTPPSAPANANQPTASAPATGDPQVAPPGQVVLGERIGATRALLAAPSGCVGTAAFNVRVRGLGIARVVFRLDGKVVKTVRGGSRFSVRVNPARLRIGVHRLVATITFKASRAKTRTLRASFQRCGERVVAPRFTG